MDENSIRRLTRLKRYPNLHDKEDDYLAMMIEDALSYFLEYTRRTEDVGAAIDGLICDLALYRVNQEGVENTKVAREGEVEREYYETTPPMLLSRLNRYRRIPGL